MPIILALIALVVVSFGGFAIVEPKLEKFVETSSKEVGENLDKVLNPGVLILVVVAIFIIVGAGAGKGG
jgi:predicted histidine transporter YuiF (NhaC family)